MLRLFWLAIAFCILGYWQYLLISESDVELFLIPTFLMLVICFPAGLLASFFISALYFLIGLHGDVGVVSILFEWGVLFVFGYAQWFVIAPYFFRLYNRNRS